MKSRSSTALALSLLLCACSADGANQGGNSAAPDSGNEQQPQPQQPQPRQEQEQPSADVELSVSPEQTSQDSTLTLTLRNGSEQQVGYNLCTSALETAGGREVPTSRVCTMELRTLEPGRTATYRYTLPVNVAQGSYRIAAQVSWMQSNRTGPVRSDAFEVRPD